MAKLDLTVEINDESLLAAVADVRQKQRALNESVGRLESIVGGCRACLEQNAAIVTEKPGK